MDDKVADIPDTNAKQMAGAPPAQAQSLPGTAPGVAQSAVGDGNILFNLQGISGSNINVNLLSLLGPREWVKPTPPHPSRKMIGREAEIQQVCSLLALGGAYAIRVAVHGIPGVGKTLLVEYLSMGLVGQYPGGVLFERIGASFRDPALVQPILDRWGSHAFGNRPLPEGRHFTPDAVRDLLTGHGALLIVLDDVWDLHTVQPLQEALPSDVSLLITTHSQRLARDLGGETFELDVLNPGDALALLAACARKAAPADQGLLTELAHALGNHAQALYLAGRSLDRLPRTQWAKAVEDMAHQVLQGEGFGELNLPGDNVRESRVEAALKYSYDDLAEPMRQLYRSLGAFADASFSSQAAAGLWEVPVDQAQLQLYAFVERGLLDCLEEGECWRQHSLLRAFSLGLLRQAGEEERVELHHAQVFLDLMGTADDRQVYSRMLPNYPQICHAFENAIGQDLVLAQGLVSNTANLQNAFGLAGESLAWAQALVDRTRARDGDRKLADALNSLGIALWRVSGLGGEDRRERLREALATHDEALRLRTPQAVPLEYAQTQNNRGIVLRNLAGLGGEDRRGRLREAVVAFDEALRFSTPQTASLDYAQTQNNRAIALWELSGLGGENRRERLREALAAFDEALRFRTPQAVPLDYAQTQNNRGIVLRELSGLGGEDRRERLREALAAFDEALLFYTPETAPLDYAQAQNNRGLVLWALSGLGREDRRERLREALAAFDEALRFRTPQAVPLDYAQTQNNRGIVLRELSGLGGEDRREWLREALAAFDEAMFFYTPETAPLDCAQAQNNRGVVLWELSGLGGEDRRERLQEALVAFDEALRFRTPQTVPLDYAMTQNNRGLALGDLAGLEDEDRRERLREALAAFDEAFRFYTAQSAPMDYAQTQNNRSVVLWELAGLDGENRRERLQAARTASEEALHFRTPETAPLDHARTQYMVSFLWADIAGLPDEDRRACLLRALQAGFTAWDFFQRFHQEAFARYAMQQLQNIKDYMGELFVELWVEAGLGNLPEELE